jgi:hypothetical protein
MPKEQKDRMVMTLEQFVGLARIASGLHGFAVGMKTQNVPGTEFMLSISDQINTILREITEEAEKRRDCHE